MKLFTSTTILITILSTMTVVTGQRTECTTSRKCGECEAKDCDTDLECKAGLKCAAEHKAQLLSIGANPIKAHCRTTIGAANAELCFNPAKLLKSCTATNPCTECEPRDCDTDDQCGVGMLCADEHKAELTAAGLDPRKAYCNPDIGLSNWELCYIPPSQCTPPDCDDNNLCTTDTCDATSGCVNTPVVCGPDEACNLRDGTCAPIDTVRPCIAVIDESDNYSDDDINARWLNFRTNWPDRPFCLLQPLDPSYSGLFIPTTPDFATDPLAKLVIVNRDNGDPALASDWLGVCGYANLAVEFIGLFIDNSGSMTTSTVQASLNKLDADLAAAGLTYCTVYDGSEDWITPFDTTLGTIGGGGVCS